MDKLLQWYEVQRKRIWKAWVAVAPVVPNRWERTDQSRLKTAIDRLDAIFRRRVHEWCAK